jgi:hypothetical protein
MTSAVAQLAYPKIALKHAIDQSALLIRIGSPRVRLTVEHGPLLITRLFLRARDALMSR